MNFSWTDIDDIVLALDEAHPSIDPTTIRFTELRKLVEGLDGFEPEPGQKVNEQILEAIQAGWIEERGSGDGDGSEGKGGDDEDEGPGFSPNRPFR